MTRMNARRLALNAAHVGYDVLRATLQPISVGVRILLVKDDAVLLVYHSYLAYWHLPGGGLKRGETLAEAARREAYEETGAVVTGPLHLLGIYLGNTRGRSDQTAVFLCRDFALQAPTDRWEIEGRAFFAPDHLPPNLTRGYRRLIGRWWAGNESLEIGEW